MGKRYLIDSNAIIDFCNGKLPESGKVLLMNCNPEISIITNIELFASKNITDSEIQILKNFVSISTIYNLDLTLVEKIIEIRKEYSIKTPDAIIAATAIVNNLVLITRNTKDFVNVKDLQLINPYSE
jgi:predicted nucleic acid-binding protein